MDLDPHQDDFAPLAFAPELHAPGRPGAVLHRQLGGPRALLVAAALA